MTLSWREPYLRFFVLMMAVLTVLPLNVARAQEIDSRQFSAMQWRLIGPFRIRNRGGHQFLLSPYFFATEIGSSPASGLEPSFLTAAPANYRFDCPRAIFFTLRLAEPRA